MIYLLAILLGIIQGISEWLPISSTAHLILFEQLFSFNDPAFFEVFKVVIQFGSIMAVLVIYFRKLNPWHPTKSISEKRDSITLWTKIIIGSLPLVIAFVLDDLVESKLSSPFVIAITLIVYGIAFILLENNKRRPRVSKLSEVTYATAFGIGLFQLLAIIPGTSRSGSTILGATILGCSRVVASEFSFFLAIPAMAGASGLKLLKYFLANGLFTLNETLILLLGTLVAFVVSIVAIQFLLSYIRKHDFKVFGYYRIILGIIVLLVFLF